MKLLKKDGALHDDNAGRLNISYLIRQGLENRRRNKTGAISSMAILFVCLLLLGAALLFSSNVLSILEAVQGENVIMVFARYNASQIQVAALGTQIAALENVEDVQFISKEDALRQQLALLKGSTADALTSLMPENPLPDAYCVRVINMDVFAQTSDTLKRLQNVDSVRENRELAAKLTGFSRTVGIAAGSVVLALIIGTLLVVMNTTRLSMQKSEDAIKIMRVVGSTERDIRIPYFVEVTVNGLIAGVLAFGVVWGLYAAAISYISPLLDVLFSGNLLPFKQFIPPLVGAYALVGLATGWLGCRFSVRSYFREKGKVVEIAP
ncbi:MAG: permease-like cell division protein FtsX [Oscillospiraceae bacterium]|jgi:cell division transport system permease protein|nr:permease-like cell division protein FtsX [Oscillospiraceae bacterium]